MELCSFATITLARFGEPGTVNPTSQRYAAGNPVAWLEGDETRWPKESVRVVIGLHRDEESAQSLYDAGNDGVPNLIGSMESWSAVLPPIAHRGEANWLELQDPGPMFAPKGGRPGGPFVVVTTVGWTVDESFDPADPVDFAFGVERVRDRTSGVEGLHSHQVFGSTSPHDPMTVTFWRDDAAMRRFAYRPGEHQAQVGRYRERESVSRTSFTRLVALDSRGTWNGSDPLSW